MIEFKRVSNPTNGMNYINRLKRGRTEAIKTQMKLNMRKVRRSALLNQILIRRNKELGQTNPLNQLQEESSNNKLLLRIKIKKEKNPFLQSWEVRTSRYLINWNNRNYSKKRSKERERKKLRKRRSWKNSKCFSNSMKKCKDSSSNKKKMMKFLIKIMLISMKNHFCLWM